MEKLGNSSDDSQYYSFEENPDSHNSQEYKSINHGAERSGQRSHTPVHQRSRLMENLMALEDTLTDQQAVINFSWQQLTIAIERANQKINIEENAIPADELEKESIEKNIRALKELNGLRENELIKLREQLEDLNKQLIELEKLPKRKRKERSSSEIKKNEEEKKLSIGGDKRDDEIYSAGEENLSDKRKEMNINYNFNSNSSKLTNPLSQLNRKEIPDDSAHFPQPARPEEEEKEAPSRNLFQLGPPVQSINESDPNSEMNPPANSEDVAVIDGVRDNNGIETFGPHGANK